MMTERAFWDTSAIIPVCCVQAFSPVARSTFRRFPRPALWWGTPVEVRSAFERLKSENALPNEQSAIRHWSKFRAKAIEVLPDGALLAVAESIPATYGLRALDAFQLAAALIWCSERPRNRAFVCADSKLSLAAEEAGFELVSVG
ncbi:MAG TPA: type II toxin-antitoxin system VapC family toxin [Pyrinomonadaceae bacterium]|nr:type II toxin-antitoxin system VapC family toxin [Pyrinomonadaceae bacterium]